MDSSKIVHALFKDGKSHSDSLQTQDSTACQMKCSEGNITGQSMYRLLSHNFLIFKILIIFINMLRSLCSI